MTPRMPSIPWWLSGLMCGSWGFVLYRANVADRHFWIAFAAVGVFYNFNRMLGANQ
jgi:hypothetical protein